MRRGKWLFVVALLLCLVLLFHGRTKPPVQLDHGWSAQAKFTQSQRKFAGSPVLYRWHGTVLALQGQADLTATSFVLNPRSAAFDEVPLTGIPPGYDWAHLAIDQNSDQAFFGQGYMETGHLMMSVLVGSLSADGGMAMRNATESKWTTAKKALLGTTATNVWLHDPGKREWPRLGQGVIAGSDMYIPYCIAARTMALPSQRGPFNDGVFHSSDLGKTWQMERISSAEAFYSAVCRSPAYYYYFAAGRVPGGGREFELWFSRKAVAGGAWDAPSAVTTHNGFNQMFLAQAGDDMVHVCWVDRRHEKGRFNFDHPQLENYEIAYRHRGDADKDWSREIILSQGMLYAYAPSMSVEGENMVVAWAGAETAEAGHNERSPNDVYFVTSQDGGKTWTPPLLATDVAKAGGIAGMPQVVLLKGVIHLLYTQGVKRPSAELLPDLSRLENSWPIYHQQRPFPN